MTVPWRSPSTEPVWSPCPPPLLTSSRWCKEWHWCRTGEESREKNTRGKKRVGSIGYSQWKSVNERFAKRFCYLLGSLFRYIIMRWIEKVYKDGTNYGFTVGPFQCVWQKCFSTNMCNFLCIQQPCKIEKCLKDSFVRWHWTPLSFHQSWVGLFLKTD